MIKKMLEDIVVEINQQPFYQILKTCDPNTNEPLMTVYYTDGGDIMFKSITGEPLEQNVDFVLCDETENEEFGQIFKFDNVVTHPGKGIFVESDDGSVYKVEVSDYGALQLDRTYQTLDEIENSIE